jgi:uncharacterized protein (TIGR01777 family)
MDSFAAAPARSLRIVLAGGSGQLGTVLARHFHQRGHHVTVLTRSPYTAPWLTVRWDANPDPWTDFIEGANVCINLAGSSLRSRCDHRNRAQILASRLDTTRLLAQVIARLTSPPQLWMNASTASIYRHSLDEEMDEESELGGHERIHHFPLGWWRAPKDWTFLTLAAQQVEAAFFASPTPRTRKIALRSAAVMSPAADSAFGRLSNLVRMGLGGTLGSGRQYVAWIHPIDFARAVEFLIDHDEVVGPVNLAAPNPLPNREFMAALREAWQRPNGLPTPALVVKLAAWLLGANSEALLKSRCVIPGRLLDAGFAFDFPRWPEAAEDLVQQWWRDG